MSDVLRGRLDLFITGALIYMLAAGCPGAPGSEDWVPTSGVMASAPDRLLVDRLGTFVWQSRRDSSWLGVATLSSPIFVYLSCVTHP